MRSRGIFFQEGSPWSSLDVTACGRYRFFHFLRDLADRDKLFTRWLGTAVPRLAQKRDGGCRRLRWLKDRRIEPCSSVGRFPDAPEDRGPSFFTAITLRRDRLDGFAERIDSRVGMLPGIEERFRIKRTDVAPHLVQFQETRTLGN